MQDSAKHCNVIDMLFAPLTRHHYICKHKVVTQFIFRKAAHVSVKSTLSTGTRTKNPNFFDLVLLRDRVFRVTLRAHYIKYANFCLSHPFPLLSQLKSRPKIARLYRILRFSVKSPPTTRKMVNFSNKNQLFAHLKHLPPKQRFG